MRTLTNPELNQLVGGIQETATNDALTFATIGMGLGVSIGYYALGESQKKMRSSTMAAIGIMICCLVLPHFL